MLVTLRKNYFFLLVLFFLLPALAEARAKIEGYVVDATTKKPIIGATVYARNVRQGVRTDDKGHYLLSLPLGDYVIVFSDVAHRVLVKEVSLRDDIQLNVELEESAKDLEEVTITGKSAEQTLKDVEMGSVKLNIQGIKKIPVVFGEADILKALLLQPGVTTVGEGAGGFNVRGGRIDQNLVLLDGIPIFNTSHLLGFFASVNPDIVQDATLYKGGIPAAYGGRLSSLLNMNTKNGNDEHLKGSWGLGPISARALLEGPIIKNKLTFVLSGRVAYPNWIIRAFPKDVSQSRAFFYDVNAKLQYKFNNNNRLSLTFYRSYDDFKFPGDTLYAWGNTAGSLKYSSVLAKNLFLDLNLIHSEYAFALDGIKPDFEYQFKSSMKHQEAKLGFLLTPTDKTKLEWGGNFIHYQLNPGSLAPNSGTSIINTDALPNEQANEMAAYASAEWEINKIFSIQAGVRYSSFAQLGAGTVRLYAPNQPKSLETQTGEKSYNPGETIQTYGGLEPRFSLKIGVDALSSVKFSYNRMRQYLHLISNTTAMSPVDFWKLSDTYISPQIADQYAVGLFRNFSDNAIEASVEAYYKPIQNLVEYKNGATLLLNHHLETELLRAKGKAYGIEFSVRKNKGRLTGLASYTFSRTWAQIQTPYPIELINQGDWYPSLFDRPHQLVASSSWQLGKGWSVSGSFTYQSGRPVTYPDGQYGYNNTLVNNYSLRNADRLPAYHRLDVSLVKDTRRTKDQKRYHTVNVSFYNLYGRQNPYSIYFLRYNLSTLSYRLSVLGAVIPSVTLNFYY
ncbi:MAG: TonB-dependent receptor [Spirosomataceae bacterium]